MKLKPNFRLTLWPNNGTLASWVERIWTDPIIAQVVTRMVSVWICFSALLCWMGPLQAWERPEGITGEMMNESFVQKVWKISTPQLELCAKRAFVTRVCRCVHVLEGRPCLHLTATGETCTFQPARQVVRSGERQGQETDEENSSCPSLLWFVYRSPFVLQCLRNQALILWAQVWVFLPVDASFQVFWKITFGFSVCLFFLFIFFPSYICLDCFEILLPSGIFIFIFFKESICSHVLPPPKRPSTGVLIWTTIKVNLREALVSRCRWSLPPFSLRAEERIIHRIASFLGPKKCCGG